MSSRALRELILGAMHGSVITGLALACGDELPADWRDAGNKAAGRPRVDASTGAKGGNGARDSRVLPPNCSYGKIGVCCREYVCFAAPMHAPSESSGDLDGGFTERPWVQLDGGFGCPETWPSKGPCTSYGMLEAVEDGRCCYIETSGSCCGRPFFDGQQMLLASVRERADWLERTRGFRRVADITTRTALARAWLRDAQLEHASIASFARFSLQLLAFGAPPDLIAAAQRAALDEVDHAQACFALASRHAERALGPGKLPMPSSLTVGTLAEAAAATVHEGCVAETIAARVALEQLQHATDEQAKAALIRIATDETRHAALAYQFVRWAIFMGGTEVQEAVQAAFAAAGQQLLAAEPEHQEDVPLDVWHAHGRLSSSEQRACTIACLRDVIEPCGAALLDAGPRRTQDDDAYSSAV